MTTENLAGLEEQRDVLLTSLRDLEQERATGEIGDHDYAVLRDDYTARAAAVLRAIEAGRATRRSTGRSSRPRPASRTASRTGAAPARSTTNRTDRARNAGARTGGARTRPATSRASRDRSRHAASRAGRGRAGAARRGTDGVRTEPGQNARRRRSLTITLVVAFAVIALAGGSVVFFAGERAPGEPVTGSLSGATSSPSSSSDRLAEALALETDGRAVDALKLYDQILEEEPDNVEALAYRGWLLKRAGLPDKAMESLDRAVAADPTFPDAHFFRGMVLYQDRDDPAGAVAEFEAFLANNPPPDFVGGVQEVLAQAQAAAAAKAAATPPPAPPAAETAPAPPAG